MINKLTLVIIMGFFSFLFGCKKNNNQEVQKVNEFKTNLEDITSRIDPEEGWSDIFLKIIKEEVTNDSHIYIAKGLFKDKVVGLQIIVSSKISSGIVGIQINRESGFVLNGVQLKSIGEESDEFIKALAELYKQPLQKKFNEEIVSATVFSLNDKNVDLYKSDYYKLKLFFQDDEDLYSEIYLNIDTAKKEIEIHEKDESYREPIVKLWAR